MEEEIENHLEPIFGEVKNVLKQKNGQFMLLGMDKTLIYILKKKITNYTKYRAVEVDSKKYIDTENTIFYIELDKKFTTYYQTLLYYYLELSEKHNIFVCLLSISSTCLNSFEKRVRSRFQHNVFFVPYLRSGYLLENKCFPSIRAQKISKIETEYSMEKYSEYFCFQMLMSYHFIILTIANCKNINTTNVYRLYREYTIDIREIKNASIYFVRRCHYDLLEFRFLSRQGRLLLPFPDLEEYIKKTQPLYLRHLLQRCK